MTLGRILLVEDNLNDVELMLAALAERADEVVVARDGEEALGYLRRQGPIQPRCDRLPAVVLLDLKLPKIDGLEVLEQIKSDPDLRSIPVVMLTASRETQDLLRSYKLGANAYVVKPMEYPTFVSAVKEIGLFWGAVNEPPLECVPRRGE